MNQEYDRKMALDRYIKTSQGDSIPRSKSTNVPSEDNASLP